MDARGAPVRAQREKALLSHVLQHAIAWGVLSANPCREVRVLVRTGKPRKRYITDEEFLAVHRLASPVLQCAMDLAYMTGLRQGDLLRLSKPNIKNDLLRVSTSKTGKVLEFELTPDLKAIIDRCWQLPTRLMTMRLCQLSAHRLKLPPELWPLSGSACYLSPSRKGSRAQ